MRYVLIVLFVLAVAAPASAQSLRVPMMAFAGAATADWVSTYQMQQRGGFEQNPLMRWSNRSPTAGVVVGAAGDAAGAYLWARYVGKRHRKVAVIGLYVAAGFRVWLAIRNDRLCRAARPCR